MTATTVETVTSVETDLTEVPTSRVFAALGDANRVRIITALRDYGESCVADVTAVLAVSQPTVSHHLRVLTEARLTTRRVAGTYVFYQITPLAKALLTAHRRHGSDPEA